ncbi:MAG: hypothetical protein KIT81_05615 [Alphaproteobacteria bacterium]|nr:hypothetical protein [Alphaproteobacteria bacterium]
MRVRSFRAADIAEAMRQVRREMGDEAIILSSTENEQGAEVIAAIDGPYRPRKADGAGRSTRQARPQPDIARLGDCLAYHGLPPRLAQRVLNRLAQKACADSEAALAQALAATLMFRPLPETPVRPLILVGPQGAGKTVSTAKLAARLVLAGQRPHLVGCDASRAGAAEQLAAYAGILGLTHVIASGPEELRAAIDAHGSDGPVLIDTAGCNPYSRDEVMETRALTEGSGAEPLLVLPAGIDPLEAADIAGVFAGLGARRLILSKLDAARRFGAVLHAAEATGLALAEATGSPYIGQGLHALDPRQLARLLLRDPQNAHDEHALDEARI